MIVAIDYDDTWTAAPDIMAEIATLFQNAGHMVFLVTARPEDCMEGVRETVAGHVNGVYATGLTGKQQFMLDRGIVVDIWIDDCAEFICGCYWRD